MSTRSQIAILNTDGTIESIYCHNDGYPSHNGRILLESYTDTKKIRKLIAQGSMSVLGAEIGVKHDFDTRGSVNICTFYRRDRGEVGRESQAQKFQNSYREDMSIGISAETKFRKMIHDSDSEFAYLWDVKHRKWLFTPTGFFNLTKLTFEICKED
jgi:hypothetical protein